LTLARNGEIEIAFRRIVHRPHDGLKRIEDTREHDPQTERERRDDAAGGDGDEQRAFGFVVGLGALRRIAVELLVTIFDAADLLADRLDHRCRFESEFAALVEIPIARQSLNLGGFGLVARQDGPDLPDRLTARVGRQGRLQLIDPRFEAPVLVRGGRFETAALLGRQLQGEEFDRPGIGQQACGTAAGMADALHRLLDGDDIAAQNRHPVDANQGQDSRGCRKHRQHGENLRRETNVFHGRQFPGYSNSLLYIDASFGETDTRRADRTPACAGRESD
jgi:hypothetical protein